jgi:hypothetical protein
VPSGDGIAMLQRQRGLCAVEAISPKEVSAVSSSPLCSQGRMEPVRFTLLGGSSILCQSHGTLLLLGELPVGRVTKGNTLFEVCLIRSNPPSDL